MLEQVSLLHFISLPGLVPYAEASEYQKRLVEQRAQGLIPDTVLFLEHPSVITRGRGLQFNGEQRLRQMPLDRIPQGVEFCETERGGDLTWHGPGQLVMYPIVKLGDSPFAPEQDVGAFIRKLESVLIRVLQSISIQGTQKPGASGVWVGERKLASVGIAIRKWVTYHGMAINVVNDLRFFEGFAPCGFSHHVMSRLMDFFEPGKCPWEDPLQGTTGWRGWFEQKLVSFLKSA